ncbi:MAG: hypothetical protein GY931_06710 [Maribacter sp.]|nr:hypothetical protein [Maribacter sp.]
MALFRIGIYQISSFSNIDFIEAQVLHIQEERGHVNVRAEENTYTCNLVFNSIFDNEKNRKQKRYPVLQQHSLGWTIKTQEPIIK